MKSVFRSRLATVLTMVAFLSLTHAISSHGATGVPRLVAYQAYLTDAGGVPVNGAVDVTVRLYDALTGGNQLFEETHSGVVATDGVITVQLGSVVDLTLPFDQQYFLSTQVNTDSEMTPRQALLSVPYALSAGYRDTSAIVNCDDGDTIAEALANAPVGGELVITINGTCRENVNISARGPARVTLLGGDNGVIEGQQADAAAVHIFDAMQVVVRDLTLTSATPGLGYGLFAQLNAEAHIVDSTVVDNKYGLFATRGAYLGVVNTTVQAPDVPGDAYAVLMTDGANGRFEDSSFLLNSSDSRHYTVGMFRIGTVRMFDDMVIQNFGDDGVLDNPDGTGTQDDGTALAVDNGGILRQQGHAIVQGKMEFFSSVLVQLRGIEATGQVRLGSLANVQFRDQAREGFSDINDPGIPDRFALRGTIRASRNSVVSFGQKLKVALREVNVSRHSGVSFGRLSTIDLGQVDLFFNADVSLSDNSTVTAGNVTLGTGSRFSGGGDNVSFTANDISLFRFSEFSLFSDNSVATVRYLDVNEDSRFNLGSNQVLNLSGTPNNPDRCEGIVCMFDSGFIGVGDNSRISPTDNAFLTYDIGSQSRITLNSNAQLDGRARFGRDSRLDAFGNSVVINGDIDAFDGSELNFGSNATLNGNIDAGQARLSANGDFTMTGDLGMQDVGGHLGDRFTLTGQIQASGNNVEFFSIGNEASVSGDIFVFFGANVGFGDDATVGNNIEVQSGNLSAGQGSTVQGNITAQFNGSFFIAAGATVGNVLASDSGAVTIQENAQINGNAEARNNGFVFVGGGSTVTGNMSLDANFGSIFLDTAQGNIAINGDLDCEPFGNDPSLSDGSVIPSVGGVLDPECGL